MRYWAFTYQQKILCVLDAENFNFVSVLRETGFLVDCVTIEDFSAFAKADVKDYDYILGDSFSYELFLKLMEFKKPFALYTEFFLSHNMYYLKLLKNNKAEQLILYADDKNGNSTYCGSYICRNLFKDSLNIAEVRK